MPTTDWSILKNKQYNRKNVSSRFYVPVKTSFSKTDHVGLKVYRKYNTEVKYQMSFLHRHFPTLQRLKKVDTHELSISSIITPNQKLPQYQNLFDKLRGYDKLRNKQCCANLCWLFYHPASGVNSFLFRQLSSILTHAGYFSRTSCRMFWW